MRVSHVLSCMALLALLPLSCGEPDYYEWQVKTLPDPPVQKTGAIIVVKRGGRDAPIPTPGELLLGFWYAEDDGEDEQAGPAWPGRLGVHPDGTLTDDRDRVIGWWAADEIDFALVRTDGDSSEAWSARIAEGERLELHSVDRTLSYSRMPR